MNAVFDLGFGLVFTCGSRSKNGKFSSFFFLIQRMLPSILRLRMLKVFKAKMFRMKI